jgi:antitoxin ParD1/3/4
MPTRNVNLTEHFDRFIEYGITSGRFSNASEVVREGLRLLEQREQEDKAKLEWLRAAAKEGFDAADRGDYVTLRSDQEIEGFVDQARREVSEKLDAERVRG